MSKTYTFVEPLLVLSLKWNQLKGRVWGKYTVLFFFFFNFILFLNFTILY